MVRVKPQMSESEYSEKMAGRGLTADGSSLIPDPTPMAPPLGYIKQPSISERIREMIRSEHLRRAAEEAGVETFDEANDFDVGDDFDPQSPYEDEFDPSNPDADHVASTGVPTPPVGGAGEGAEGGKPAASAADKPAAVAAAPGAATAS